MAPGLLLGTEISFALSGRILKSCRLQTYGKHDENNNNNNNNNNNSNINNNYNNDNDSNNDIKQQFIFYYCRQLKEYDNDSKMEILK